MLAQDGPVRLASLAQGGSQPPKVDASKFLTQPLVKDIYTADPSAQVFGGRIFIYPSHDIEAGVPPDDLGSHFAMRDYHVFSMDRVGGRGHRSRRCAGHQERAVGGTADVGARRGGEGRQVLPVLSGEGQAGRVPDRRGRRRDAGRPVHRAAGANRPAATASIPRCSRTPTASTTCISAASGAGSCSAGRAAPTRRRTSIRRRISPR